MHHKIYISFFLLVSPLIVLAQPATGFDLVETWFEQNLTPLALSEEDINEIEITDSYYSRNSDVFNFYFRQSVNGTGIFGTESNAHVKNGALVTINQRFQPGIDGRINSTEPEISMPEAISRTAIHLGNLQAYDLQAMGKDNARNKYVFNAPALAYDEILAARIYFPVPQSKVIRLAYEVAMHDRASDKWWQVFVDAKTGEILDKISWTVECSFDHIVNSQSTADTHDMCGSKRYNRLVKAHSEKESRPSNTLAMASSYHVFPVPFLSPLDGPSAVESDPWTLAPNASPYGWHDTNGTAGNEYTITRGNNVLAQEDRNGNNGTGYRPDGGTALNFNFTFDEHDAPVDYQDFAITNLFFWNNIMHDVWYQYGFDEAAGNFQQNNYGNGGTSGDYVLADAQDGSGTNNANFYSPPDGTRPRMQMFEWSATSMNIFKVTNPAVIDRHYGCAGASFGPQDAVAGGEIVLAAPLDGCSALTNPGAINGKIALIDRGTCSFTTKVLNAQNAGAIGAVICQNADDPPFDMGGSNASITIPSVMISKLNCDTIKAHLPGVDVTLDLNSPVTKDSDLENGIIAHEYGHGISIRLTGGPSTSSCLNNQEQMGEGWSDWFGMVMTIQEGDIDLATRGMGAYVTGEPLNDDGIRTHPYTTDININDHTYDDIKTLSVPHGVGSVWGEMLWEMTWGLIDQHGWDPDLYAGTGGNNIAMELVIEGLKLQPCSPGFVDGRDAILLADQNLNGGANECIIWEAFAKRGLGYSASQGSSSSVSDGTEAFDLPPACLDTLIFRKTADFQVSSGNTVAYVIEVTNQTAADVTNVIVVDTIPANTTLVGNSLSCGSANGGIITIDLGTVSPGSTSICEFTLDTDNVNNSMLTFFDGVEAGTSNWTVGSGQGSGIFATDNSNPFGGSQAWFVPNLPANNSQYLESVVLSLPQDPLLVFHHFYDTESNWDGGMVEISTDNGTSWTDLEDEFIYNGYNGVLGNSSNNDIDNRPAFTGNSAGYIESIIDLQAYSNQDVMIRFFFGSDNNTVETGWYIDNITIFDATFLLNRAWLTNAQNDTLSSEAVTIVKTDCNAGPILVYDDNDNDTYGLAGTAVTVCDLPPGFALNNTDCDDTDPLINPGAVEICDGVDNNCDGTTDENCGLIICDGDTLIINVLNDTEFAARDHIQGAVHITPGSDILFSAGIDLELISGFEVELGAVFEAIIEDCQDNN